MRRASPLLVLPLLFAVLVLTAAAPTTTGVLVDEAAAELRQDPVYVHPDAERALSDGEAEALRDRIRDEGLALFVAVLPAAAADEVGDVNEVPQALGEAIGLQGTVATVVGSSFRAGSSTLSAGVAGRLATESFAAERDAGTAAVLARFVDEVAAVEAGRPLPSAGDGDSGSDSDSDSDRGGLPSWVLPAGLIGGGAWLLSRRRRRTVANAGQQRQTTADVEALRAGAQLLGEDVLQLEPHVTVVPAAQGDYEAALSRFRFVEAVLPNVDTDEEVARTQRVLDEGHYAMSRAKAIVEGRQPPPPPADLARPGTHAEPALTLDDRGAPSYAGNGGPFYGGGGGWFGGGGGLLTGLVLGQVLGGGFGWGGGWGIAGCTAGVAAVAGGALGAFACEASTMGARVSFCGAFASFTAEVRNGAGEAVDSPFGATAVG